MQTSKAKRIPLFHDPLAASKSFLQPLSLRAFKSSVSRSLYAPRLVHPSGNQRLLEAGDPSPADATVNTADTSEEPMAPIEWIADARRQARMFDVSAEILNEKLFSQSWDLIRDWLRLKQVCTYAQYTLKPSRANL